MPCPKTVGATRWVALFLYYSCLEQESRHYPPLTGEVRAYPELTEG